MPRSGRATSSYPHEPCRNCGDPTAGDFCPSCGQRKSDVRASLAALFHDLMEVHFGVERRTPNTLFALFFRPGFLSREYLDGRVVRYLSPFKLYLASSLVLFVLVGFLSFRGMDDVTWDDLVEQESSATVDAEEEVDTIPQEEVSDTLGMPWLAEGGPWQEGVEINLGNERLNALVESRIRRLGELDPLDAIREVVRTFLNYVPTLMFLLLPVFAGLLKLLYVHRRMYYAEHFIVVLHLHAFVFGIFALVLLSRWIGISFLSPLLILWAAAYVYLALRRVYCERHLVTALKYLTLGWAYLFILILALPPMLIVTLLLVG
jgi:hypothetical protein